MKILYFAWIRSKTGVSEETVSMSDIISDVDSLVAHLRSRNAAYESVFNDMNVIRTAVNQEYITENVRLVDADEVAFFPPVTGG